MLSREFHNTNEARPALGVVIALYAIVFCFYLLVLVPPEVILALTAEDGLIETPGTASFLLAS